MTASANRVLVIGRIPAMNAQIVASLQGLGFAAVGSTAELPELEFHARDLDLVALGSGVDPDSRARMHAAFHAQRAGVRVLDVYGPIAVEQIAAALRRAPDAPALAAGFLVLAGAAGPVVHLELADACRVRLEVHHLRGPADVAVKTFLDAPLAAGPHALPIPPTLAADAHVIVARLDDAEFHVHRLA